MAFLLNYNQSSCYQAAQVCAICNGPSSGIYDGVQSCYGCYQRYKTCLLYFAADVQRANQATLGKFCLDDMSGDSDVIRQTLHTILVNNMEWLQNCYHFRSLHPKDQELLLLNTWKNMFILSCGQNKLNSNFVKIMQKIAPVCPPSHLAPAPLPSFYIDSILSRPQRPSLCPTYSTDFSANSFFTPSLAATEQSSPFSTRVPLSSSRPTLSFPPSPAWAANPPSSYLRANVGGEQADSSNDETTTNQKCKDKFLDDVQRLKDIFKQIDRLSLDDFEFSCMKAIVVFMNLNDEIKFHFSDLVNGLPVLANLAFARQVLREYMENRLLVEDADTRMSQVLTLLTQLDRVSDGTIEILFFNDKLCQDRSFKKYIFDQFHGRHALY